MASLFVWEMQCEFIMVNTFHLKQALGEMQQQGLTLGLKLEPDNVPFLCCTRMKNHSYFSAFAIPMHLDLFVHSRAIEHFQPEEWRM